MKRDMDLIRRLMLAVEAAPPGQGVSGSKLMEEGDAPVVIAEHLHLLMDHGFLKGVRDRAIAPAVNPNRVMISGITWAGHEFLDAVRDDNVWQKTKDKLAGAGGSASLEIVTQLAASILKQMLGLAS